MSITKKKVLPAKYYERHNYIQQLTQMNILVLAAIIMVGGFLFIAIPEHWENVIPLRFCRLGFSWKQRFKYARLKSNKPTFKFLFRLQSIKTGRIKEG